MSKIANLQVGKYNLTLEVSRTILMDAFSQHPKLSEAITNGKTFTISETYDLCKTALLYMGKEKGKKLTKEKVQEIFNYTDNCFVEVDDKKTVATDLLVKNIMDIVNLGFTIKDNAEKIEITTTLS